MSASLSLVSTFGIKGNIRGNIHYLDETIAVYPCGHVVVIYNTETKMQSFIRAADSSVDITAVAVSPNGRTIAVAESTPTTATVSLHDAHTLKKRKVLSLSESQATDFVSISFSSDSKCLLTQSGAPDWSLSCWSIEKGKQLAMCKVSNTQGAPIHQADFSPFDNTSACASGDGILKFFKFQDGILKNAIINMKRESQHYLCHVWLPGECVVVSTKNGELLLFESYEFKGVLAMGDPGEVASPVYCLAGYSKGFVCGCTDGIVRIFEQSDESREYYKLTKTFKIQDTSSRVSSLAISPSEDSLACSLANHQIYVLNLANSDILKPEEMSFDLLATSFHGPGLSGSPAITGMDTCIRKPLVATCGLDRTVRVYNYFENTVELMKTFPEEAYSLAFHPSGLMVLVGFADKLRLMNLLMDDIRPFKQFPIKACRECQFSNGGQLFAAVNGNGIQIFRTYTCECIVTLRAHGARVQSLSWTLDDRILLSSGADGAVIRWDVRSGRKEGEHTKRGKLYPCVVPANNDCNALYAVNADKSVLEIEILARAVKTELEMPQAYCQLVLSHSGRLLFAGGAHIASGGGSVTMFKTPLSHGEEQVTLRCHSGSVTRMRVQRDDGYLFTSGEDGVLAVFKVHDSSSSGKRKDKDQGIDFAEEILVTKSDLEEKTTLMKELENKVDELTLHNEYQLRLKDMKYNDKLKEVKTKFTDELDQDRAKYDALQEEKGAMEKDYESKISQLSSKHERELETLEITYKSKVEAEVERYQKLEKERDLVNVNSEENKKLMIVNHERHVNELISDFEEQIAEEAEKREKLRKVKEERVKLFESGTGQIEEDADFEIEHVKVRYDKKLAEERTSTLRLKGENGIMKKKFTSLQNDIEGQKETIKANLHKESELHEKIKGLEKDIMGHKKEIKERDETIHDKEKRIYDLKKKNQELEKFKFVLDYKIKELKRQIEPRELEISDMRQQITEMDLELEQYHKSNAALDLMIGELRLKIDGMEREIDEQRDKVKSARSLEATYRSDLRECVQHMDQHKVLKSKVKLLYKKYVQEEKVVGDFDSTDENATFLKEYKRQREYLERSVAGLKRKLAKDVKLHETERMRLMKESVQLTNEINLLRREMKDVKNGHRRLHRRAGVNPAMPPSRPKRRDETKREIIMQRDQIKALKSEIRKIEKTMGLTQADMV